MMEKFITKEEGARLVDEVANQYLDRGLTLEELQVAGERGLKNAMRHFIPRKGKSFLSHAVWFIRQNMLLEIKRLEERPVSKELSQREKDVICYSFGFGYPVLSLDEISQKMNLSRARVCQIRRNALEKMIEIEGESLDRIAIENIAKKMISESTTIHMDKEDLDYLYSEKEVVIREYYSHPLENETRIEAILRDVKEDILPDYRRATLLIMTSPDYPLLMEELDSLHEFFQEYPGLSVRYGIGKEKDLQEKLYLLILSSY